MRISYILLFALALTLPIRAETQPPRIGTTAPGPYTLLLRSLVMPAADAEIVIADQPVTLASTGTWQSFTFPAGAHPMDWAIPTGKISEARIVASTSAFELDVSEDAHSPSWPLPFRSADAFLAQSRDATPLLFSGPDGEHAFTTHAEEKPTLLPYAIQSSDRDHRVSVQSDASARGRLTLTPLRAAHDVYAHQTGIYVFQQHEPTGLKRSPALARFLKTGQATTLKVSSGYVGAFLRYLPSGSTIQGMAPDNGIITMEGFHARERQHHGPAPFKAWTAQAEAAITVPVVEGLGIDLRVGMLASPENVPDQGIVLRHEGRDITFGADSSATLQVPARTCAGKTQLRIIVHARTWQPSVILKSGDTRQLGVMINTITLRYTEAR